ncbi:MAG: flagellar assembly protein FliW [Treponema sp.]|nr:flagellar assembly protein FliW [Treponema sp.]
MKVATKAYGLIEVDKRQKISFPQGLFGFEALSEYVLLDADRQPFYWLQSLDVEQVAFVLVNPFLFRPDYELNIGNEELADIGIVSPEKALIFSIVTIPPDGGPMTANLQGPLIINRDTRAGKQAILSDTRWKTKHDIMAELVARGTAANAGAS